MAPTYPPHPMVSGTQLAFCSQCFNEIILNDVKGFFIYLFELQILGGGQALDQVQ